MFGEVDEIKLGKTLFPNKWVSYFVPKQMVVFTVIKKIPMVLR